MLPSDYKRRYRYKTDTTREKRLANWLIWGSIIAAALVWYFIKK